MSFSSGVLMVQVRIDTRYGIESLHQCGRRVKTKTQNVLGANPLE